MKPKAIPFVLTCALFAGSLQAADKVTYNDQVMPILRNSCLNCHNPDKKKAGLDLSTYQAALAGSDNGKVLESGNPSGSLLVKCIKQTEDPKMPPKGDKLSDADIAVFEKWIAGQLLETVNGKAVAASNNVQVAVVSLEKPSGPPPMPGDLPLDPVVQTKTTNALVALAASPWAPLVAVGGQKQVVLYNTDTLQPLGILPFSEGFPTIIRFSRNGQLLMTGGGLGGKSGEVVLWDVKTGDRAGVVGNEFDQVLAADLSPDQQHVALGGPGKLLKIYSTKDGKLEVSIKKHTDWVTAVAYSADGKFLASADRAGGIAVWEGATGKEYISLPGHKVAVTALAFMPGVLASASEDGTIVLWDVKEGKEIRKWDAHKGGAEWVDFTTDGRLVSSGRDHLAKVWDQNGKNLLTSASFDDIALRAVMSNERMVAGDWTGRIRVFAMGGDNKPIGELSPNPPAIADHLAEAGKQLADAQAALAPLKQAVAEAEKKAAETTTAAPAPVAAPAPAPASANAVADLQKQLDDLNTEIARRREARAKLTQGTPEYETANAKVQEVKPRIADAEAKLDAAKKAPAATAAAAPAPAPAAPAQNAELAKAKAEFEKGNAKVAEAQALIDRWKRAAAYMGVHKAKTTLTELQARFDGLTATAKDAMVPADNVRMEIVAAEKVAAAAPAKLKEREALFAEATKAAMPLNQAVGAAEEALKQKEADFKTAGGDYNKANTEATDLGKKLEQQNAEVAKLREERGKQKEGTPEYAAANDKVQAKKAEIATTQTAVDAAKAKAAELKPLAEPALAAVAKAKEALEQARTSAKTAGDKLAAAEKDLAQTKKDIQANATKLSELQKQAPGIIDGAKVAKAKAEREAAAAAKELQAAKTQAERVRADYDAHYRTEKAADTGAANGSLVAGS